MFSRLEESTDVQDRSCYLGSRAALRRAEGQLREALADGVDHHRGASPPRYFGPVGEAGPRRGGRSGVHLGRVGEGRGAARPCRRRSIRYSAAVPRRAGDALPGASGRRSARLRGRRRAVPRSQPSLLACRHAARARRADRATSRHCAEAREIFERLEARPWLERLDAVAATRTEVPA